MTTRHRRMRCRLQLKVLNVGDVVNKYNGGVNTEAENGTFVISILMPFPDAAHDIKTAV